MATEQEKTTKPSKAPAATATRALAELQQEKRLNKPSGVPLKRLLRVYLVPVLVVSVFALILFILIIPGLSTVFDQLDQASRANVVAGELDGRIQRLQQMAAADEITMSDLNALNVIMPEAVTEVVNFQQQVRRMMGEQNGLSVGASTTAEQAIASASTATEATADDSPVVILEIPTTFSATGRIQQIRAFIDDISELNSFVAIGEMNVSNEDTFSAENLGEIDNSNQWRLTITLIKYQFASVSNAQLVRDMYINRAESAVLNQEALEYIRSKAE